MNSFLKLLRLSISMLALLFETDLCLLPSSEILDGFRRGLLDFLLQCMSSPYR